MIQSFAINELTLARLCDLSYEDHSLASEAYSNFDRVYPVISADTEATCLVKGDTLVVVVRGTDMSEAKDVAAVMKSLVKAKHRSGKVHRGFNEYCERILTDVSLICSIHSPSKIVLAGHSLGGAVATIMSTYMKRYTEDVTLFTIGCPRVGNREFAEWIVESIGERLWQYSIGSDIVTKLPPSFAPWGYKHSTGRIHLEVGDSMAGVSTARLLAIVFKHLLGKRATGVTKPVESLAKRMGWKFFADHSREAYRRAIVEDLRNLGDFRIDIRPK